MNIVESTSRLRLSLLLSGSIAIFCMAAIFMFGATQKASAGVFCSYGWVNPGAKCWGSLELGLNYANVWTYERAGCIGITNGSNGVVAGVVCGPAMGGGVAKEIWGPSVHTWTKAVLENNNPSSGGFFKGEKNCLTGC